MLTHIYVINLYRKSRQKCRREEKKEKESTKKHIITVPREGWLGQQGKETMVSLVVPW